MKHKKSILQDLYDGKIYPSENIIDVESPEYQKINSALMDVKERLTQHLSDGDRELFAKIEDLYYELNGIYSYQSFAHGFRLGVKLMAEALNGDDDVSLNIEE